MYELAEIPSAYLGWRSFMLVKGGSTAGAADERRITRVGPGEKASCTCRAKFHPLCRHRDALRDMVRRGVLPPKRFEGA